MNNILNVNSFNIHFNFFGKAISFDVYFYAICIVIGMISAACLAIPLFKKHRLKPDILLDLMIAIIPICIVFARIFYILFALNEFIYPFKDLSLSTSEAFSQTFKNMINIRDGGLAIYGGILGGALGVFIVSKVQKVSMAKIADIAAAVLPLGQAIGRLGNYFNQEVYGLETTITREPISVFIENTGEYHLALCFYEMFLNLILFFILYQFMLRYKGKRNLYSMGAYFLGYGIIRGVLEPFRMPDYNLMLGPFKAMVLVSIAVAIAGISIISYNLYKDITEKNYWWKNFFNNKQQLEDNEDVK